MTTELTKAYLRGYNRARFNKWPDYIPPLLPDPAMQRFVDTARSVRNTLDTLIATSYGDLEDVLGPLVDEIDAACRDLTNRALMNPNEVNP